MIKDQYEELVRKLDSFYTSDGTPTKEWNDPERSLELWSLYEQLMDEWEKITIKLYDATLQDLEGKPLYSWHISYEILKLKLTLLEQVNVKVDKEPLYEEIKRIEDLFAGAVI